MIGLGCFLGGGRFAEQSIRRYSGDFQPRHLVLPGDLVLANTDLAQRREVLGSPAVVPSRVGFERAIFTHHVFAARFLDGKGFWRRFVYYSLLQDEFRERAAGFATGTTVLALPRDAVLEHRIPSPPLPLVAAFDAIAGVLTEGIWTATQMSGTLAAIRDALLPRLISGEVRVRDADVAGTAVSLA